jgi:hypothetical protein
VLYNLCENVQAAGLKNKLKEAELRIDSFIESCLTCHTKDHLTGLRVHTELCSHHHNQFQDTFITLKRIPDPVIIPPHRALTPESQT